MGKKKKYINPLQNSFSNQFTQLDEYYTQLSSIKNSIKLKRKNLIYDLGQEILAHDLSQKQRDFLSGKFDKYFKDYNLIESLIRRSRFAPEHEYTQWSRDVKIYKSSLRKQVFKRVFTDNELSKLLDDLNDIAEGMFKIYYSISHQSITLYIQFDTK